MRLLVVSKENPNVLFSIFSGVDHIVKSDNNNMIIYGDKEEFKLLGLINVTNANIEMED